MLLVRTSGGTDTSNVTWLLFSKIVTNVPYCSCGSEGIWSVFMWVQSLNYIVHRNNGCMGFITFLRRWARFSYTQSVGMYTLLSEDTQLFPHTDYLLFSITPSAICISSTPPHPCMWAIWCLSWDLWINVTDTQCSIWQWCQCSTTHDPPLPGLNWGHSRNNAT